MPWYCILALVALAVQFASLGLAYTDGVQGSVQFGQIRVPGHAPIQSGLEANGPKAVVGLLVCFGAMLAEAGGPDTFVYVVVLALQLWLGAGGTPMRSLGGQVWGLALALMAVATVGRFRARN